nr:polysaccharide biosynthesis protein [Actinomycetota bacterium]
MNRLNNPVYRHRALQIAVDAVLVAFAFYMAFRLRFLETEGGVPDRYREMLSASIGVVVIGKLAVFGFFGLYEKWWRYFRMPDLFGVMRAVAASSAMLAVAFLLIRPFDDPLPRSVIVSDFLLTLTLVGGVRLLTRMAMERPARRRAAGKERRTLVVGAGSGGQMVVRELQLNPNLATTAIGYLDDDPRMRGSRLHGVRVLGTTDEIDRVLDETAPDEVTIAIPSAPGELRGKVVAACREREIAVRTLPTVFELLRGGVQLNRQLREVQVEDVLGREPVKMELDRVGAYVQDKVVMITGAGGSIGSELVRQVARVGPKLIVMLDHAEDNLFRIDRELTEERHFTRVEAVLADCKEGDRMLEVMQRYHPDIVFHAAAYKHVPLMEANPLEAVRN